MERGGIKRRKRERRSGEERRKKGSRGGEQIGEEEKIRRREEKKKKREQRFLERRRVERVESRGMLFGLQEISGFILQHRHLHILPYFIIIIFFNTVVVSFYSNC